MDEVFGAGGILERIHERFEPRPEQIQMSDFIMEALLDGEHALLEAGTGVGKTLAYLVPALIYCLENGKKLAVSTETKTLQKQLIEREIRFFCASVTPVILCVFNFGRLMISFASMTLRAT